MFRSALFLVLALVVVAQAGIFCPETECKECFSLISLEDYDDDSSPTASYVNRYGCPPEVNPNDFADEQYEAWWEVAEYVQQTCWYICGGANWATDPIWRCGEVDTAYTDAQESWDSADSDIILDNDGYGEADYRHLCVDGPKCAPGWNNCHEYEAGEMFDYFDEDNYFDDNDEVILGVKNWAEYMEWYYTEYYTYDSNYDIPMPQDGTGANVERNWATFGGDGCESNTKCCPHGTEVSACTDLYPNVETYICNTKGACGVGQCGKVNGFQMGNCDGNELNGCEANLTSITTCGPQCTNCWSLLGCDDDWSDDCYYNEPSLRKRWSEHKVQDWQCKNQSCAPVCMTGAYNCDGDVSNGCESLFPCCKYDSDCSSTDLPEHMNAFCRFGVCIPQCEDNFVDCNRNVADGCETYSELPECGYDEGDFFVRGRYVDEETVATHGYYLDYVDALSRDNDCTQRVCCRPRWEGWEPTSESFNEKRNCWALNTNGGIDSWGGDNEYYSCDENHACIWEEGADINDHCSSGYWDCNGEIYDGCETTAPCCTFVAGNNWDASDCYAAIDEAYCCSEDDNIPSSGAYYCDENHACAIGRCDDGYADCDGEVSNGCEDNLMGETEDSDDDNCGVCGNTCSDYGTVDPSPNCVAGECTARYCDNTNANPAENYYDCNGDPTDGCESRTKCCEVDADCKNAIPFSYVATYKCNQETHSCEVATCGRDGKGRQRYNCDLYNNIFYDSFWDEYYVSDDARTPFYYDWFEEDFWFTGFAYGQQNYGHATGCESLTPCCEVHFNPYLSGQVDELGFVDEGSVAPSGVDEDTVVDIYHVDIKACKKHFPRIATANDLYCDVNNACVWDNQFYEVVAAHYLDETIFDNNGYGPQGRCEVDAEGQQWYDCDNDWRNGCESRVECCLPNGVLTVADEAFMMDAGTWEDSAEHLPEWVPVAAGQPQQRETAAFCDLNNVAGYQCVKGQCAIGTCMDGTADCDALSWNGCEVNLNSNPNNCGSCGNSCAKNYPNAARVQTWGCNKGCFPVCQTGSRDCNKNVADGCEFQGTVCGAPAPSNTSTTPSTSTTGGSSNLVSSSGVVTSLLSLVLAVLLL